MSIYGIGYDTASDSMILQTRQATEEDLEGVLDRAEREAAGDPLLDTTTLSSMADKLSRFVKNNPMGNAASAMAEDLEVLQQEFVGVLSDTLLAAGLDVSQDIILKRGADGGIVVAGSHPDREAIEDAIAGDERLQTAFAAIEEQSEVLSKLANNRTFKNVTSGLAAYMSQVEEDDTDNPFLVRFQEGTMRSLADLI